MSGGPGTMLSMNTAERKARNDEMALDRKFGEDTGSIARRFGLTDRQTRRILAEHRSDPARELVDDPVDVLEATLRDFDREKEKLALIAATATSDGVRLRAISARVRILERKTALIQSVGLLPPAETMRFDRDVHKLAAAATEVFRRFDVPDEAAQAIFEEARRATSGG
jgi:hypothetical protein